MMHQKAFMSLNCSYVLLATYICLYATSIESLERGGEGALLFPYERSRSMYLRTPYYVRKKGGLSSVILLYKSKILSPPTSTSHVRVYCFSLFSLCC